MMVIDLRGTGDSLDKILKKYSTDLSKEIVIEVMKAIDEDADRVLCVMILTDTLEFKFTASRHFYEDALRINLQPLIDIEDYETCALVMKYINKLSPKLLEN